MLLQVGINHLTVFFNSIQFVFLVLLMYLLAIWLYLCQVGFSYISIPEKDSSIAITGTLQLVFTQTEDSAPVTFWSSGYPAKAFNTSLPGPQVLRQLSVEKFEQQCRDKTKATRGVANAAA